MQRVLSLTDLAWVCAFGVGAYKAIELGPYEAAILLGRCVRVFWAAVQGYL